MTCATIENIIIQSLADRSFPVYLKKYSGAGFSEADVLGISNSGIIYEFEIKMSRSDFLADFKNKDHKHFLFKQRKSIHLQDVWKEGYRTGNTVEVISIPNKFYYVCPSGLIRLSECPEYAGLIYIDQYNTYTEFKPAPFLHHNKANERIYKNIANILCQRVVWGCAYRTHKLKK